MLSDIVKFKIHIQKNLGEYEDFVNAEVATELAGEVEGDDEGDRFSGEGERVERAGGAKARVLVEGYVNDGEEYAGDEDGEVYYQEE